MSNAVLMAAVEYTGRGWCVTPVQHRDKAPVLRGWPQLRLTPADLGRYFDNGPTNIGVLLGAPSGNLVDVDLDAPEALRLAEAFLPRTEAVFGRPSKPRSHWLYLAAGVQTRRYRAPDDAVLLEVRADGAQTVVPPSVHPSGERVEWAREGEPAPVAAEVLLQRCARLAAAALLVRAWPKPGGRHAAALALAGALLRAGWDTAEAEHFVRAVADTAHDEEVEDRVRCVRDTAARLAAGGAATGLPTLTDQLGPEVAQRVAEWLGLREPGRALVPGVGGEEVELEGDFAYAQLLAPTWPARFRWTPETREWRGWDGQRWAAVPEELVGRAVAEALVAHFRRQFDAAVGLRDQSRAARQLAMVCRTAERANGVLYFLRGTPAVQARAAAWDRDAWVLNVANGLLDLRSGTLRPHDPAALCTRLAPVVYDPAAQAPAWERHLERCLPDPTVRRTLQRHLGMALVGDVLEHELALWYGSGANGKTTTLRVILGVFGDYAGRAAPDLLVRPAARVERHPVELADLAGLRLVFATETGEGRRLDEVRVKELTGGDPVKARFLRANFFQFQPSASLVQVTNHLPRVVSGGEALWRRLRVIPWTTTLPEDQRRPQNEVVAELLAEAPGILNWLLAGLEDWQREPRWVAPAVREASRTYRSQEDTLANFLAECCVETPRAEVAKADLYAAFARWAEANGETVLSPRVLYQRLCERGVGERRGTGGQRLFVGLGLRAEGEAAAPAPPTATTTEPIIAPHPCERCG